MPRPSEIRRTEVRKRAVSPQRPGERAPVQDGLSISTMPASKRLHFAGAACPAPLDGAGEATLPTCWQLAARSMQHTCVKLATCQALVHAVRRFCWKREITSTIDAADDQGTFDACHKSCRRRDSGTEARSQPLSSPHISQHQNESALRL